VATAGGAAASYSSTAAGLHLPADKRADLPESDLPAQAEGRGQVMADSNLIALAVALAIAAAGLSGSLVLVFLGAP
jgi:hypothetical protein